MRNFRRLKINLNKRGAEARTEGMTSLIRIVVRTHHVNGILQGNLNATNHFIAPSGIPFTIISRYAHRSPP